MNQCKVHARRSGLKEAVKTLVHTAQEAREQPSVPLALVLAGAGLLALAGCGSTRSSSRWTAWVAVQVDGETLEWKEAPETLTWRAGEAGEPDRILTAHLAGPYPKGAWTQHAGAVLRLEPPIPAGQPFAIRFRARSLEGPPFLSALRRWGGSRPWRHVTLTDEWQTFEMVKVCEKHATAFVTFSLSPKPGGLHTVAQGRFELADVEVVPRPDVDPADLPRR